MLTIGWGHTNHGGGRPFNEASIWTQLDCDRALEDDLVRYEQMVTRRVKVRLAQESARVSVSIERSLLLQIQAKLGELGQQLGNLQTQAQHSKNSRTAVRPSMPASARWSRSSAKCSASPRSSTSKKRHKRAVRHVSL